MTATPDDPDQIPFTDRAAIRRWIDRVGGIDDTARSLGMTRRTVERIYSGAFPLKRRIARELAAIAGEPEAVA